MISIEKLFEIFVLNNTKGMDGVHPNAKYFREYGNVPFEESFKIYLEEYNHIRLLEDKIKRFENYLKEQNCQFQQSNISESRYYYYKCIKYRFSSHIYPTGSMTNHMMGVVDFASDPELIMNVEYWNNK